MSTGVFGLASPTSFSDNSVRDQYPGVAEGSASAESILRGTVEDAVRAEEPHALQQSIQTIGVLLHSGGRPVRRPHPQPPAHSQERESLTQQVAINRTNTIAYQSISTKSISAFRRAGLCLRRTRLEGMSMGDLRKMLFVANGGMSDDGQDRILEHLDPTFWDGVTVPLEGVKWNIDGVAPPSSAPDHISANGETVASR